MALCVLIWGCSADEPARGMREAGASAAEAGGSFGNAPATSGAGSGAGSEVTPGSNAGTQAGEPCLTRNLTQPCSCSAAVGAQRCDGSTWSTCECLGATAGAGAGVDLAGNLREDITFEWARTSRSDHGGECPPGEYEGNFQGIYYSYIATVSGAEGLGVPIVNLQLDQALTGGGSGFHFTVDPAEGGETTQRVAGVMEGTADGLFPFVADIVGELDCSTGNFIADMRMGRYSVLADGLLPQTFEGIMTGRYDHRTSTLVDGIWDVRETSAMPPGQLSASYPRDYKRDGYGGSGEWAAALPTDTSDPALQPCAAPHACQGGPLGPGKLLCGDPLLGPPACFTDADCDVFFPGEGVTCLNASALSICLRECTP